MMIGTHRDWEYLMPGNGTQIDWTRLVQPLISLCVSVCQRISRYGPQIPRDFFKIQIGRYRYRYYGYSGILRPGRRRFSLSKSIIQAHLRCEANDGIIPGPTLFFWQNSTDRISTLTSRLGGGSKHLKAKTHHRS